MQATCGRRRRTGDPRAATGAWLWMATPASGMLVVGRPFARRQLTRVHCIHYKNTTAYYLFRSLVEHSCINPKSLAFGYLDEKPINTGLMKFLGLYPSALSWYLEFTFAFSTSLAPFMTNALPP
ncbi:hypothetical protein BHM03_00057497 [Ensete ventricosum]|nr:hypothetical protein BHM03_00057497 [Ensete ventricosum]